MDFSTKVFELEGAWACAAKAETKESIIVAIKGPFDSKEEADKFADSAECRDGLFALLLQQAADEAFRDGAAESAAKDAIAKAARPEGSTLQ